MSRENFFVKATLKGAASKGDKADAVSKQIHINVSNIAAMVASDDGGTTVLTVSGVAYECKQTPEYFVNAGKGYGVISEIGNG